MKTRCLGVQSVTYAQKAKNVLSNRGIQCQILRQPQLSGCGWCIAIPQANTAKAEAFLRENGVKITGEHYDLP